MSNSIVEQMIAALNDNPQGAVGQLGHAETYHVAAEFLCVRMRGNVKVQLLDGGPDFHAPDYRYNVRARLEDGGPVATGNGARTPEEALDIVHWNELGPGFDEEEPVDP